MTLDRFFAENNKVAIAFSGGVDSAYLLYAAVKSGADAAAYYVRSAFQPQFEYDDAIALAGSIGANLRVIDIDVLSSPVIVRNPHDRCYYCKKMIMEAIRKAAEEDGYPLIIDGTNASDDVSDRPGVRALEEYGVRSPLRECSIAKEEVRKRSKEAGLFTWNKPAYACLATRISSGEIIDEEKLETTERAEDFLHSLGFSDFRVRMSGSVARIQINKEQFPLMIENRELVVDTLKKLYDAVLLDLEARDD